jgi:septal ring factor EnvC (AmiA/AmiB activator)
VTKKPTIAELEKALAKAARTEKRLNKRIAELESRIDPQPTPRTFPWEGLTDGK